MMSAASTSALKYTHVRKNRQEIRQHQRALVDSLSLSCWRCIASRFGLHGLSALCDQTLPPGGMEVTQQDEMEETVKRPSQSGETYNL